MSILSQHVVVLRLTEKALLCILTKWYYENLLKVNIYLGDALLIKDKNYFCKYITDN